MIVFNGLADCIFPQNFAQHVATPMHVTQSQYDAWQLPNILKLGCDPPKGDCSAAQLATFQQCVPYCTLRHDDVLISVATCFISVATCFVSVATCFISVAS